MIHVWCLEVVPLIVNKMFKLMYIFRLTILTVPCQLNSVHVEFLSFVTITVNQFDFDFRIIQLNGQFIVDNSWEIVETTFLDAHSVGRYDRLDLIFQKHPVKIVDS